MEDRDTWVQRRDVLFAQFLQNLESEEKPEVLRKQFQEIIQVSFLLEDQRQLSDHKRTRLIKHLYGQVAKVFNTKRIRTYIACVILGVVVTLIPTFLYLSTIKNDGTFPFRFVPNTVAYPKTRYVQVIDTEKQLELVKNSPVRDDSHEATIGAVVSMGSGGLIVWSKNEVRSPHYHLTTLPPQQDKAKIVGGYTFIPNGKISRDPLNIELLLTSSIVDEIKKDESIVERDYAEIGAGVYCPQGARCFIIPKKNLALTYEKVIPLYQSQKI